MILISVAENWDGIENCVIYLVFHKYLMINHSISMIVVTLKRRTNTLFVFVKGNPLMILISAGEKWNGIVKMHNLSLVSHQYFIINHFSLTINSAVIALKQNRNVSFFRYFFFFFVYFLKDSHELLKCE